MNKLSVKIFISGDFCPARRAVDLLRQDNAAKSVFGDFCEIIQDADISITNLECPLTRSNDGIKKIGPNLKAPSEIATLLESAGFDLVTLANNHIYDYGQQGLCDTLEALQRAHLSYVGAGPSLKEAQKTFLAEVKGIKLAIVNFAEVEFSCADKNHGGANPMDLIDNVHQIQDARNNADHVLVVIHGGHEHYHYPSPETLKRYRFYAENGASAVIAHHTHCIGGYENWKGVPIFYSLGNFFFPTSQKMPDLWYEGYALLLEITKSSVSFEILPYEQCKDEALSINIKRSHEILEKIEKISLALKDEDQIMQRWRKFTEERSLFYLTVIAGFSRYKIAILRRLGLLDYFYKKSQLNIALQITRCEAHREAAREVLSDYLK
jgi:poly-gamma-glutamate synthesis protein (capsule biosynthesis protein)